MKTIIFFIFFGLSFFVNQDIALSQCKVVFCTCCEENLQFAVYPAGGGSAIATFWTDDHGCSIGNGINFSNGQSYQVVQIWPACDNNTSVYFTACVCGEDTLLVKLPCCLGGDGDKTNKDSNPVHFKLNQNFPNPFNPSTKIDFQVPAESSVKITVYDITGKVVDVILNTVVPAGNHNVIWNTNGKNLSSGVYFYKLESGSYSEEKKMLLIK
jgi:hypothetical protein